MCWLTSHNNSMQQVLFVSLVASQEIKRREATWVIRGRASIQRESARLPRESSVFPAP